MISSEQFQYEAQNLGINRNSQIVIYDNLGIYSSPRAWWLFKLMGFINVAVLDGGLPAWKHANYPLEIHSDANWGKGNFKSSFRPHLLTSFETIQSKSGMDSFKIIDARSKNRFECLEPETRKGLQSGTIPNSLNLLYSDVLLHTTMLHESALHAIFNNFIKLEDEMVFSCGSGVTACILALAAELARFKKWSVYNGSWTEYGSITKS